jgi:hypothetical protein
MTPVVMALVLYSAAPDLSLVRMGSPLQTLVEASTAVRIELPAGRVEGPLVVTRDLHLVGAGRTKTVIDGGGLESVVIVMPGVTLTLEGVTLRGGVATTRRPAPVAPWAWHGTGGGLRALERANVVVRDIRVVDCAAGTDGSMIFLGKGSTATLEDVEIGASHRAPGVELYDGATWIRATSVRWLAVRGLRFLDEGPIGTRELLVSASERALLSDVTMRERVGTGCTWRVWLGGVRRPGKQSYMRLEGWVLPTHSCTNMFVADDLEVDYARMKWPDFTVPPNVTEVR